MTNNTNNGSVFFGTRASSTGYVISAGGILADFTGRNCVFDFENNTNYGSIEGSIMGGCPRAGGLIGLLEWKPHSIRGNANNGKINISFTDVQNDFTGGVIGLYGGMNGAVMKDNLNNGNVTSISNNQKSVVCGLVCTSTNSVQLYISNSVNKGTVEGTQAYGISSAKVYPNNIVSMGVVNGKDSAYSFWGSAGESSTTVYGFADICVSCANTVKLFYKNESDGNYQLSGDSTLLDVLLNEEVEKQGYSLRWDNNLLLVEPSVIHIHIGYPVFFDDDGLTGMRLQQCVPKEVFKYHLFASTSHPTSSNEFSELSPIHEDIDLIPHYRVTISGGWNGTFFANVTSSVALKDFEIPSEVFKYHLFVYGTSPSSASNEYKESSTVEGDVDLVALCKVTVNGGANGTYYVEGGRTFDECGIAEEVWVQYHLFENGSEPSTTNEIVKDTVIDEDIDVVPYCMITIKGELN